jgi:hypothetical protein
MINDSEYNGIKTWKDMTEAKQDADKLAAGLLKQIEYSQRLEEMLKTAEKNVNEIILAAISGDCEKYLNYDIQGNKYCKWGIVSKDIHAVFEVLPVSTTNKTCQWMQADEDNNTWAGECGIEFNLENDTPEANGMIYCPKCGKLIDNVEGYRSEQ